MKTVAVGSPVMGAGEKVHVSLPVESLPPGDYTVSVQEVLSTTAVDRGMVPLTIRAARPL